ncbi:SLC13/DASS family transporter [Bacteroidetes/Chlorobi group bacterium Naka2016]|jgi:sodium-dependent dicarboxylate transporter 2/3/5|nr:MAG: SLC13/DASS family transporter [Bacteroidetes/Chlorobi group bacterium Naka2016]
MKFKWFALSLAIFTLLLIFPLVPSKPQISHMLAMIVLMGILWLTEALPIGITAMLPLVFFPVLNISNANQVSINYFNSTIFLFLGGFIISIAIEKTGLHRKIALNLLKLLGQTKDGIFLAFAISSWFLSMFISNTATALIMLPIAISITNNLASELPEAIKNRFSKAILFGIAYSCSIGGIATLIGTPPNLIFHKIYSINFPNLPEITFSKWLSIALPLSLILLLFEYLLLRVIFFWNLPNKIVNSNVLKNEISNRLKLSTNQAITLVVFVATCLLWIFRTTIDLGFLVIPGWADLLGLSKFVDDSTVSIFSALLLFILPNDFQSKARILQIDDLKKVPWDIILLFGGGFAIANGFEITGLSDYLAQTLVGYTHLSGFLIILLVCIIIVATTEFSSNTAVASTFLPIVASISQVLGIPPIKIMLPATISSSLAFMLPISTPPNAIVFSTGKLKISEMAVVGITLNIIGILVVAIYFHFLF